MSVRNYVLAHKMNYAGRVLNIFIGTYFVSAFNEKTLLIRAYALQKKFKLDF